MKQIELTDEQAKVVQHLVAQEPLVVRDDQGNRGMTFVLASDQGGNTTVATFNRYLDHSLVHVHYDHMARIETDDADMLDALCAAWIAFRAKYLLPYVPEAMTDEELEQHLDDHPF